MAKSKQTADVSELEALAVRLEALQKEALELGEERVGKSIGHAVKSARWADKQRTNRIRRVGKLVVAMQSKGLTAEEIVRQLGGN